MLLEGPPGPEGPTVSQSVLNSVNLFTSSPFFSASVSADKDNKVLCLHFYSLRIKSQLDT